MARRDNYRDRNYRDRNNNRDDPDRMPDELGFVNDEDRVNCPFYFKIGSCRNGDRCNRLHQRPEKSNTLLFQHMYPATPETLLVSNDDDWDDQNYSFAQEHFEIFFEEVFLEMSSYGEVEDMVVCDNVSEHMLGNVYIKFVQEEAAEECMRAVEKRFYAAKLIQAEYCPVKDFREARCKAFYETRCTRGGMCNFMHLKHCPKAIKRKVVRKMYDEHPEYNKGLTNAEVADPARSRSPPKQKKDGSKRMSSEERKAMIAKWNKERITQTLVPGAPPPPPLFVPPPPPVTAN